MWFLAKKKTFFWWKIMLLKKNSDFFFGFFDSNFDINCTWYIITLNSPKSIGFALYIHFKVLIDVCGHNNWTNPNILRCVGDFRKFWPFSHLFWSFSRYWNNLIYEPPRNLKKLCRSGNRILRLKLPWRAPRMIFLWHKGYTLGLQRGTGGTHENPVPGWTFLKIFLGKTQKMAKQIG